MCPKGSPSPEVVLEARSLASTVLDRTEALAARLDMTEAKGATSLTEAESATRLQALDRGEATYNQLEELEKNAFGRATRQPTRWSRHPRVSQLASQTASSKISTV